MFRRLWFRNSIMWTTYCKCWTSG